MANARPNATYIPPVCIGAHVGHYTYRLALGLTLGIIGSCWARQALCLVCQASLGSARLF